MPSNSTQVNYFLCWNETTVSVYLHHMDSMQWIMWSWSLGCIDSTWMAYAPEQICLPHCKSVQLHFCGKGESLSFQVSELLFEYNSQQYNSLFQMTRDLYTGWVSLNQLSWRLDTCHHFYQSLLMLNIVKHVQQVEIYMPLRIWLKQSLMKNTRNQWALSSAVISICTMHLTTIFILSHLWPHIHTFMPITFESVHACVSIKILLAISVPSHPWPIIEFSVCQLYLFFPNTYYVFTSIHNSCTFGSHICSLKSVTTSVFLV